jgi:hypothetical protein
VQYVHEDDSTVRFIFTPRREDEDAKAQDGDVVRYARFDKETKNLALYHLFDSRKQLFLSWFMQYKDGRIMFVANFLDSEDNPALIFINEEDLLK